MHTIKWGAFYGRFCYAIVAALLLPLAACSTAPPTDTAKSRALPAPAGAAVAINKHPLAKYIEIDGFRITESGPGKLKITFAVINHSEADIGDLGLKMQLITSADKPGEAPIAEFEAKVPSLGPLENKEVSVVVPTTMRVYELPDWQFLRGRFEITSPSQ